MAFINTIIFPHRKKGVRASPRPAPCYHARGQLESWRGSEDGIWCWGHSLGDGNGHIYRRHCYRAISWPHARYRGVNTAAIQIINRPSVQLDCNYLFVVGQLIRTRHFQRMNIFSGYPHPYCYSALLLWAMAMYWNAGLDNLLSRKVFIG